MGYKLNTDGWLIALGAALTMAISAGLMIYVDGLGWLSGIWATITLIAVRWAYKHYRKEKYRWL